MVAGPGDRVTDDPDAIAAEMAQTRADLADKLDALKGRLFRLPTSVQQTGRSLVAKAKAAGGKSASKAKTSARAGGKGGKTAARKASASGGRMSAKTAK